MKLIIVLMSLIIICFSLTAEEGQSKVQTSVDSVQTPKITFVELGSVNCIPCKQMQPVMAAIEEEYADTVKVVFHDVWTKQGKKDGKKYKIKLIPTQVFLDENGVEFFRHEGFFSQEEIELLIDEELAKKKEKESITK